MDFDDYLPLGGHLLPEEFQIFLYEWNTAIAAYSSETGEDAWQGESRRKYKADHPELWEAYHAEFKRLDALYREEVKALKAYQKEHQKIEALEAAIAADQEPRNKARAQEEEIVYKSSLSYANAMAAMQEESHAQNKNEVSLQGIE